MSEEKKIEAIVARIKELLNINSESMEDIAKEIGSNNMGYAFAMGGYDDLKLVLSEIESGEIYEEQV